MNALKAKKFRVGDKVEVIEDNNTTAWFNVETQYIVGKIVKVISYYPESTYIVKVEGYGTFQFRNKHLKLVGQCKEETQAYNPLVAQEGGGHYKNRGIQPLEYTMQNNLSFCEGNVVKYISRYKSKNGVEDLAKVIHYALLASYEEYGEQGSTELKEKVLKLLGEHG